MLERWLFPFAPDDGGAGGALAGGDAGGTPGSDPVSPPTAPTPERPGSLQRPTWLPEADSRFFDPAKGFDAEKLYKSYGDAHGLIGKRIGELDETQRGVLLDIARPEIESLLAVDIRAKLAQDEEWLAPLLEARLPKPPEAYELPAALVEKGLDVNTEDPLYQRAVEVAKARGLPQEAFGEFLELATEMVAPYLPKPIEERLAAAGPDFPDRAVRVRNTVRTLASRVNGPAGAQATVAAVDALLAEVVTPAAFQGLEALVRATNEKPLTGEVAGSGRRTWTREQLDKAVADPRYRVDRAYTAEITAAFQQLFGGDRL
jgi:hypothetical protein